MKSQNRVRVPLSHIRRKNKAKIGITIQKRILLCIDKALKELGASAAEALYYYLENNFGLSKNKIPRRPKTFMKALDSIFGEKGTELIERICIKKLEQEFNLKIDERIGLINVIQIIIKGNKSCESSL